MKILKVTYKGEYLLKDLYNLKNTLEGLEITRYTGIKLEDIYILRDFSKLQYLIFDDSHIHVDSENKLENSEYLNPA